MKRLITLLILGILIFPFLSAEIILSQPNELYNLGDSLSISSTIKTNSDVSEIFQMYLICNGQQKEILKYPISLEAGQEERINPSIKLITSFIGKSKGTCKIKAILGNEYVLGNEFKISDLITMRITSEKTEFEPGEQITVEGEATKENSLPVNGYIELNLVNNKLKQNITQLETINNGYFSVSFRFPEDIPAGQYTINLKAYEKDNLDEITNNGYETYNIKVKQIPKNLELILENEEIEPNTNLKVKAILHDQSGESIKSIAVISVKDSENKILEQIEKSTEEFLEYPIKHNEKPSEWTIYAISNKLESEVKLKILEKKDIKIELINRTVLLTNIGNIPYNDTVLIKIGNESLNINTYLDVDEEKKYILSAPDGEYKINIIDSQGNEKVTGNSMLTGNAIEIRESEIIQGIVRYPFVWIFIIGILGFISYMFFKKGYKKSFFGYIQKRKEKKTDLKNIKENSKSDMTELKNKAILSLSIKGDKQDASIISIKIKNINQLENNSKQTLKKISEIAEDHKALLYENGEYLFYIIAPSITKTFRNEKTAIQLSEIIKKQLDHHNSLFKNKIEYGISINYGTIVAKKEGEGIKFMSLGNLISTSKKIAGLAKSEILLTESIDAKLKSGTGIKTERKIVQCTKTYKIQKIIEDNPENKKFLKGFLDRLEKDKN